MIKEVEKCSFENKKKSCQRMAIKFFANFYKGKFAMELKDDHIHVHVVFDLFLLNIDIPSLIKIPFIFFIGLL